MKRPPSDGRCIHCRVSLCEQTEDHVFPKAWYPDSTPQTVNRWTAPSCRRCNKESGEREQELLLYMGLCVDPRKLEAAGIAERVKRSFGIGVKGLSPKETRIREARKNRVLASLKPFSENQQEHIIPGLGPHHGFPLKQQIALEIPSEAVYEVSKKIVRGCEFWLANGRIIDEPYDLSVYLAPQEEIADVLRMFQPFGPIHRGPGFRIRRAATREDPLSALYEIWIWDTWTIYCSILFPEILPAESN